MREEIIELLDAAIEVLEKRAEELRIKIAKEKLERDIRAFEEIREDYYNGKI